MALAWQVRPRRMSSTIQLRTRRPFRTTALLVVLIFAVGLVSLRSLEQFHVAVCQGASSLASSGLCSSDRASGWNLFHHLGGNGPWIRKKDGLYYYDTPLPKTCRITQAHMVSPEEAAFNLRSGSTVCPDLDAHSWQDTRSGIPQEMLAGVSSSQSTPMYFN
jgi:hypothetical protein